MADYYPLIARAIAGLDPSAPGESRRALYERARAALIAQLRSVQPPLSESEITRERLALEEAVRKVESEAAQRARDASRASGGAARAGDAIRRAGARAEVAAPAPAPAAQSATAAPRPRPAAPPPPPLPQRNDRPPPEERQEKGEQKTEQPRPPRNGRAEPVAQPTVTMQDPQMSPVRERTGAPARRGPDGNGGQAAPGLRGFRDITADADDLGRATAQANRAARKTYASVPPPVPEIDRLEPGPEGRSDFEAFSSFEEPAPEVERAPPPLPARTRIAAEAREREPKRASSAAVFPFKSAIAIGIVLILAGAAILWGRPVATMVSGLFRSSSSLVEAPKDSSAPLSKPKITDRVGQPSSSDQVAPVAQRVVLYDEDPSDPKGKQYVGTVIWRTEPIKASGNQPADIAVRAEIDIPDRKFKMTMSFRRNTDSSLPASHTAELTFLLPPDFAGGGVGNVPGILMKSNEQARGTPLAGLAVKVTDGFFLLGLSNVDADRARNIQLLKERSWFDVPLVYSNQRRAIIAIEKGEPGERAFNDAFAVWGG
ncbi:MAG: hypothetical protein JOY90_17080 [Bradyrhizobium sp.]|uniref:hypothetical protein n=1 Tax=Bradyrhizobium sp. TaxID=376 RepID=UPI001DCD34D9|nr:hypothetical protein [Bradyrhizobium sp.]MBV9562139.1 hypothetical protein [Bradyrhizobium sp.]